MLDLDDIQHVLLSRAPARTGRFEFLSLRDGACARAWLAAIQEQVRSAAAMRASLEGDRRWVTVAFTCEGLRALGVDEAALATFPAEFQQGMAARAAILGDLGPSHPDTWAGGLASPDLHAVVVVFARDGEERGRWREEHDRLRARCEGVEVLSALDADATPPFEYPHDHFGYRDQLSRLVIEGSGEPPDPGAGGALKAGEFILGYDDEAGSSPPLPRPEVLARNGSFMAYRRIEEHVGRFREFLAAHAGDPEGQELLAAKLMGRWRSGAPLVLAPDKDDPTLAADPRRRDAFDYTQDPHGYAVPLGAHIRRMNPRGTEPNTNRHRVIRRGATYGPHLPEGAPDDGAERGVAAFVLCASLVRQFEFVQNVWVNDRDFRGLRDERDPIIGAQDGALEFKIPQRPIRRTITGLPAFTTVRGGAYFFLPGLAALRWLAAGGEPR